MSRFLWMIVILCLNLSVAEVPMLNSSTVKMPQKNALHKCVDADNKVTYTQFECQKSAEKIDGKWVDEANLTYLTSDEKNHLITKTKNIDVDDTSGVDLLKKELKDQSLMELFDQGIKALMMRQEILNAL